MLTIIHELVSIAFGFTLAAAAVGAGYLCGAYHRARLEERSLTEYTIRRAMHTAAMYRSMDQAAKYRRMVAERILDRDGGAS